MRKRITLLPDQSNPLTFEFVADPLEVGSDRTAFQYLVPVPPVYQRYELSSDKVKSNRKQNVWHSFEHFKSVSEIPRFANVLPVYATKLDGNLYRAYDRSLYSQCYQCDNPEFINALPFGEAGKFDQGLPLFVDESRDGDFVVPPDNLNALNQRALAGMLPVIRAELSLLNSLVELKDVKTIAKSARLVRSAIAGTAAAAFRKRSLPISELIRTVADLKLQYAFNIRPLLSDIAGIRTSLALLEKRVNRLVSRAGALQSRHYAFKWKEFTDSVDEVANPSGYDPWYWWSSNASPPVWPTQRYQQYRDVRYDSSTFHGQIQYNYNYTDYQLAHAQELALLDSFGANYNPQVIWNAIPWSFVIDWVSRVGDFLDQFKVSHMNPRINIQRYLWSVRRSRTISVRRGVINSPPFLDTVQVPRGHMYHYPVVKQTAYKRVVQQPESSWINSSGLSQDEITLASALVLSRRRRGTTPRPRFRGKRG